MKYCAQNKCLCSYIRACNNYFLPNKKIEFYVLICYFFTKKKKPLLLKYYRLFSVFSNYPPGSVSVCFMQISSKKNGSFHN